MAKTMLPIRVEPADVDRIDEIARVMGERAGGLEVTRSDAARVVLHDGLPVVEKRLGITPPPKESKPARKPK